MMLVAVAAAAVIGVVGVVLTGGVFVAFPVALALSDQPWATQLLPCFEPSARTHCDSAWDPRVLLTLETRMEHGNDKWCAA